jgi:hypothetical protein
MAPWPSLCEGRAAGLYFTCSPQGGDAAIPPPVSRRLCSRPFPIYSFPTHSLLLRSEACLAEVVLPVPIRPVTAMDRSQNVGLLGSTVRATHNGALLSWALAWISAGNPAAWPNGELMSDHPKRECSAHGTDLAFVGICDPGHTITDKCVFRWFSAWSTNTWLNANPSCSSRTIRRTHRNSAIARGHQRRNGERGDSGIVPKANRWWSILP